VVALLREVNLFPQRLPIAGLHRSPEDLKLGIGGGIVKIILALNLIADSFEHIGQSIAERPAASIADMNRPDRIGTNKLHLHLLPHADIALPIILALGEAFGKSIMQPTWGQVEVDKAGSGHFYPLNHRGNRKIVNQVLSNLAGICLQLTSKLHSDIAGKIAVLWIARRLYLNLT